MVKRAVFKRVVRHTECRLYFGYTYPMFCFYNVENIHNELYCLLHALNSTARIWTDQALTWRNKTIFLSRLISVYNNQLTLYIHHYCWFSTSVNNHSENQQNRYCLVNGISKALFRFRWGSLFQILWRPYTDLTT